MTLQELTGQESGIIVYPDESGTQSVAVWNWQTCGNNQIPMLSPFGGMLAWPSEGIFNGVSPVRTVNDVRTELPGTIQIANGEVDTDMDILYDCNGDLTRLFLGADDYNPWTETTPADIYTLTDGTKIIAPHGWN